MSVPGKMHSFFVPGISLIGVGACHGIPHYVHTYHITKPLIVTDKGIVSLGLLKRLKKGYEKVVFVYLLPEDMKFIPDFDFSISGCRTDSTYHSALPLLAKIYDFLQGALPDQDFIVDLVSLSTK